MRESIHHVRFEPSHQTLLTIFNSAAGFSFLYNSMQDLERRIFELTTGVSAHNLSKRYLRLLGIGAKYTMSQ